MAVRFLDLDPVRQPVGTVRIEGQDYTVWPITVGSVINLNAQAASSGDDSFGGQLAQSVDVLRQMMPEAAEELLTRLTVEQLNTLLAFARGQAATDAEKNSEAPSPVAA